MNTNKHELYFYTRLLKNVGKNQPRIYARTQIKQLKSGFICVHPQQK